MSETATRPANSTIAMPPIRASVFCAFLIFGNRNAGTPLAMASTPVRAEQPEAKARSSSSTKAAWATLLPCTVYDALSATGALPSAVLIRPMTTITKTLAMKR